MMQHASSVLVCSAASVRDSIVLGVLPQHTSHAQLLVPRLNHQQLQIFYAQRHGLRSPASIHHFACIGAGSC
jgi:hypothetical protein